MKDYLKISNSSQVKENSILVEFSPFDNSIRHFFRVNEIRENGIEIHCPSGAYVFISNDRLSDDTDYFKLFKRV